MNSEEPEQSFLADMGGIFNQHAAMWSIYMESVKLLVSITSLPILAAAVLISASKDGNAVNFASLPPVLSWALVVLPILDLLLLGVVIQHRLVILFYARALNGYRRIYLDWWNDHRRSSASEDLLLPMPVDASYPRNYEPFGPMGLIVHGSAMVNALYVFGAAYTQFGEAARAWVCALLTVAAYEGSYALHCKKAFWAPNRTQQTKR
ncbi:MAG: hypothetical protein PVI30_20640 [Myxococcales bacterium]|jgi:hypothetical protein